MSTWDDNPNDYAHALIVIDKLRAENERFTAYARELQERISTLVNENERLMDKDRPRWIADLNNMELTERQSDNSYRVAYTLKQVE
jgi:hypothetical protein